MILMVTITSGRIWSGLTLYIFGFVFSPLSLAFLWQYPPGQQRIKCSVCGQVFAVEPPGPPASQYPQSYGSQYPQSYGSQYPQSYGSQYPQSYGSQYPQSYASQYPQSYAPPPPPQQQRQQAHQGSSYYMPIPQTTGLFVASSI